MYGQIGVGSDPPKHGRKTASPVSVLTVDQEAKNTVHAHPCKDDKADYSTPRVFVRTLFQTVFVFP